MSTTHCALIYSRVRIVSDEGVSRVYPQTLWSALMLTVVLNTFIGDLESLQWKTIR